MIHINELNKSENSVMDETQDLPSVNSTNNLIDNIHKSAIINEVKQNKEIKDKFIEQARKTVNNELQSINQENISRRQKTTYDANKEACNLYGIDDRVPLWQIRLMKLGSSLWFIMYWVFATFTIVPINVFFRGIKTFIKNNYIVFIFAVICYLIIVLGIPLLLNLL